MRIALVHDWLTGMRGGEYCLEALCEIFPRADIFTLLHVPGSVSEVIEKRKIRTSFLQHMPGVKKNYRYLLPLFPVAVEGLDLTDYPLVVSISHCVAKGIKKGPRTLHICYCLTPMRYIWDMFPHYFSPRRVGPVQSRLARRIARWLRR